MVGRRRRAVVSVGVTAVAVMWGAPAAKADGLWVAVANSPNREQQDWAVGPDRATAEMKALRHCAQFEEAADCRVLASSPDCIATAWDVAEPLNQIYAVAGSSPDFVSQAVMAAAGPYANDLTVRCTWWANSTVI